MGLFDYVHYQGKAHQTKDFDDPWMMNYYIEGGRLFRSVGHTEDRSQRAKWQREHPGEPLPPEQDGIASFFGCMTWVETGREDMNFHGVLNFYAGKEYNAKFTDGDLVEVLEVPEPAEHHYGGEGRTV